MDLISDLKVMTIVSFCWPQLEPAIDFRMLIRGRARSQIDWDMGGEGEVGVKSDTQDLRGPTQ